jgi:hypothetical protein
MVVDVDAEVVVGTGADVGVELVGAGLVGAGWAKFLNDGGLPRLVIFFVSGKNATTTQSPSWRM